MKLATNSYLKWHHLKQVPLNSSIDDVANVTFHIKAP